MDMEIMMPSSPKDFNFDSACTTPYISAPSSPPHSFHSAPTSPTRASAFYQAFHGAVPFHWESKPGIPKSHVTTATSSNYGDADQELDDDADFAFDFSGHLDSTTAYLPADELFQGGQIKPLKPPPRFQYDQHKPSDYSSPKSPRSPKDIIRDAFSPKYKKKDFDPFAAALEQTRNENNDSRGRERTNNPSNSRHKKNTRSLSPFRVSDLLFDLETNPEPVKNPPPVSSSSSFWYKKWKIKDLLLFRSASESRATDKDIQLKKYTLLKKTHQDDVIKNSSFRSTESVGSISRRKSGPPISAHELHYTVNRAVSEEMKKRTSLPYKQGLLGCLGFHPTAPETSKGLNSNGSSSRA